ncbi:MAG: Glu/Leu/Phe/Val dehydrogenase [Planctomycetota bacterium]|nr:MAG: Glu/Leu/Phe/Val dehydrogenase [Planctomycetota bacterium]
MSSAESRQDFFVQLQQDILDFHRIKPELELSVRDPDLDVEGYVVVWNLPEPGGFGKGGTRVTPTVSLDEVGMLARTMSLKNAAAGVPMGGAKSGIRGNPRGPGFKQQFQAIARRFKPLFPEHGGPFGGMGFDMGARPEFVDWFIEATGMPQRFTGKPAELGGTDYDLHGIAGLGVAVAARAALMAAGGTAEGASFAVQGLGAMGAGVVRWFSSFGGHARWVSDPLVGGAWELPDELDPAARQQIVDAITAMDRERLHELLREHGKNIGPPQAVLYQDVDVLFPCAVHDVIHKGNVSDVIARVVSEGANGPCTADARDALQDQGAVVLPDFLANSGGIIAAWVEMTEQGGDKAAEAKRRTEQIIDANVRRVLADATRLDVSPYQSAMSMALRRVFRRE